MSFDTMHGISRLTRFGALGLTYHRHFVRSHGTLQHSLRVLDAPHISWARDPGHVYEVVAELQIPVCSRSVWAFPMTLVTTFGILSLVCTNNRVIACQLLTVRQEAGFGMCGLNQPLIQELIMLGLKL